MIKKTLSQKNSMASSQNNLNQVSVHDRQVYTVRMGPNMFPSPRNYMGDTSYSNQQDESLKFEQE